MKKSTMLYYKNLIKLDRDAASMFRIEYELNDKRTEIKVFKDGEIRGYKLHKDLYSFYDGTVFRNSDGKKIEVGL